MKAVEFVFVGVFLIQYPLGFGQGVLKPPLRGQLLLRQLPQDIPINTTDQGFQLLQGFLLTLHLLGMMITMRLH